MIEIGVAYAIAAEQVWHTVQVPERTTVKQVIELSGILNEFPQIDLNTNKIGIFGHITSLDHFVSEGDRVEIYRPILIVPENLQRKKYRLRKLTPAVEKAGVAVKLLEK